MQTAVFLQTWKQAVLHVRRKLSRVEGNFILDPRLLCSSARATDGQMRRQTTAFSCDVLYLSPHCDVASRQLGCVRDLVCRDHAE